MDNETTSLAKSVLLEKQRVKIAMEKAIRSRKRIYRFTQNWFHDFLVKFADVPKGSQIRGIEYDFETGDFKVKFVNNSWGKVKEGAVPPMHFLKFKNPIDKDMG